MGKGDSPPAFRSSASWRRTGVVEGVDDVVRRSQEFLGVLGAAEGQSAELERGQYEQSQEMEEQEVSERISPQKFINQSIK